MSNNVEGVMGVLNGSTLKEVICYAYQALEANKEIVNSLNVFPVPDGDTGTNMSLTMRSAVAKLQEVESPSLGEVGKCISEGSLMGARGNSGVILSQLLRGFGAELKDQEDLDRRVFARAMRGAANTAYKAVMRPTEGTILTVARKMAEYADDHAREDLKDFAFFDQMLEVGDKALAHTPEQLPILKEAGVVDAGGQGLMILLHAAREFLSGERKEYIDFKSQTANFDAQVRAQSENNGEIRFGYCTEFLIHTDGADEKAVAFRESVADMGDSQLVVGAGDVIKTHIHTNHPGRVLEMALELGYLEDIKIDNMRLQYQKLSKTVEQEPAPVETKTARKKYSFIAVSAGDGMSELFREMGVDEIITGGQTMNPSTEDFMNAIGHVNADHIFLLPNNSNIILAATQAKELSEENVYVIPTRTQPEGFSALFAFDSDATPQANEQGMVDAIAAVRTGLITYAVRDSVVSGTKIEKGNYIGLERSNIHSTGHDLEKVVLETLEKLVDDDSSLITLFYGEDVAEADAQALVEKITVRYSDCDVDAHRGGQPIYYYILSVE